MPDVVTREVPSLRSNTSYNAAATLAQMAVGLVWSPILLSALGLERFGLWSLLWAATGSLGLADPRLSQAITPLAAEAAAKGDREALSRILSAGLALYAALALAEIGAATALARWPVAVAWLPAGLREEASSLLVPAVAVFALNALAAVFTGFLQGLRRYDVTALLATASALVRGVALVLAAWDGASLGILVRIEGAAAAAQLAAALVAVMLASPETPRWRLPGKADFARLLSFGGKLQVAHFAHWVNLHGDKLLLSAFLDLRSVAYYELGSKAAYAMRSLPLLLVSAVPPVAAGLETQGKRDELWRLYRRGTRLLASSAAPLLLLTLIFAPWLLRLWAGVTAPEAAWALRILAIGYVLNLLSGMAYSVALGLGRPEIEMRRSLLMGVLNPALSALLIPLLGFAGAPLGTALALAAGSWYLMNAFHGEMRRGWGDLWNARV